MKKQLIIVVTCFFLLFTGQSVFAAEVGAADLKNEIDSVIGTPYRYGGTTTKGFDCSGFVRYVFDKFNVDLPRTSVSQADTGEKVSKDDLRAGDLVFFNTSGKGISHAGIYIGDGKFAHASTSRGVVINNLSDNYYKTRYVTARRVLDETTYSAIAENN